MMLATDESDTLLSTMYLNMYAFEVITLPGTIKFDVTPEDT